MFFADGCQPPLWPTCRLVCRWLYPSTNWMNTASRRTTQQFDTFNFTLFNASEILQRFRKKETKMFL